MTKKLFLLFLLVGAFNSSCLFGQEVVETPQHFGQFYNNPLLNIARNGLDSKIELNFDNQRNVGRFRGPATSYFSLFISQKTKKRTKRKSKNVYGLYFYDDRQGSILFKRRAFFSFARHQQLTKKWNLSLAVSGGFYTSGIKPTNSTGAYSDNSFEGNSSLLFYSDKFQLGLSMNQFTNSSVQPVTEITRLKRHYYLFSQYKWKTEEVDLIPSVFVRYMNYKNPLSYTKYTIAGASIKAVYKIVMGGIIVDSYGVYLTTGLNNWEFFNYSLNMDFSYFMPTTATNINVNRMELNLKMKFNGRKEVTFFN